MYNSVQQVNMANPGAAGGVATNLNAAGAGANIDRTGFAGKFGAKQNMQSLQSLSSGKNYSICSF